MCVTRLHRVPPEPLKAWLVPGWGSLDDIVWAHERRDVRGERARLGQPSRPQTTSLGFGTLGQVHLAFGDACLSPGSGSQRLTLPFQATATWLDQADPKSNAPALLTGTVWTDQPGYRWLTGFQAQVLTLRGYLVGEELTIDLSDDQLIALERARGEDDLSLVLNLQAVLLAGVPDVHPVATNQFRLRIARARWVDVLEQVGAGVSILLRVPSPLTDAVLPAPPASAEDAASLAQAAARLRQARAELRDHQWEHCVATCRRVLENLGRLARIPSVKQLSDVPPQQRSQDQRWAAIYHDVKSLASAAHHDDETTDGFTWRRADTEAILAATAGLLCRYTAS